MIDFTHDAHVHTYFSPDADKKATFLSYVERAKAVGIKSITFTDHVDFDAKHPLFEDVIDYDDYIEAFNQAKKEASLPIYLGVEVGYQAHVKDQINAFLAQYPFEFVILSVHYVKEQDLYTQDFFEGRTKEEAYTLYFDQVLDAIGQIAQFDVIGHLDYITRYSPFGLVDETTHQAQIERILKALVQRNKGIELNTSGFATEDRLYPTDQIINRFIELGGSRITIGSDAHKVSELGRFFNKVQQRFQ